MAFCQNCGANLNDAKFCAGCGAPAPQAEPMAVPPPVVEAFRSAPGPQPVMAAPVQEQAAAVYRQEVVYQQPAPVQTSAVPFPAGQPQVAPGAYGQQAGPAPVYQPQPPQAQYAPNPAPGYQQEYPHINATNVQGKKGMAILAYFAYLVLIPIFAAKEDRFARYHANQGLVLCIVLTILTALSNAAVSILSPISTMLALVVTGVLTLLLFVVCIFCFIGIINAAKGRMKPVPMFGGITLIK